VIGVDSGIEAAVLGGRPGIASARWAADGVQQLLDELADAADRRARYVCVIVAIGPDGEETVAEGTLAGAIATARSGAEGFGYDPVFVPEDETRTSSATPGRASTRIGRAPRRRSLLRSRGANRAPSVAVA
jgi:XTP/dITP diphosphohydrolase